MKKQEPEHDWQPSTAYPGYVERREGDYRILRKQIVGRKGIVKLGMEIILFDPLPWDAAKGENKAT